ncbi:MAG: malto-oligosyltrehalose trehalohydrolase [Chloroflexi bacterium]|nr:malto-oligosyltrehalose trehalohydrolase [Chloroflexota bacterium]
MTERDYLRSQYLGDGRCRFVAWAPAAETVEVHVVSPGDMLVPLEKDAKGYCSATVEGVGPGTLYFYRLDGAGEYPDPASRCQPQGVHGPSQVVASGFLWDDAGWRGIPFREYVIYELHVGAFTSEGTFEAAIPFISGLRELGITALELMPVARFPGGRNWGYDGVYPFAVQDSYGGPAGLKRLVDACHKEGMAVILDVVYNHLGPEGNYFEQFGPYFTDRYQTPWGKALNFDGPHSDEVRRFFVDNAHYWFTEFHVDSLRLDALHAILDFSPRPFLEDLAASVKALRVSLGREIFLIGESDANDRRLLRSPRCGGYGLDAQWNDDFHHALHVLLTGEKSGYYRDFVRLRQLEKAFREGFVYSGQYSLYRKRRHGSSSKDIQADRFVVFIQNHDQVGNRMLGTRLSQLVSFDKQKVAAGVVILSPFIPLIFMGEEYGETAPFQYFVSHSDPALIEAVRQGRRHEFAAFRWQGEIPDPQDEATFLRCKLDHGLRDAGHHRVLEGYYRELLRLRKETPALCSLSKENMEVKAFEDARLLYVRRRKNSTEAVLVSNFADRTTAVELPFPAGRWRKSLDTADEKWLGGGSRLPDEFSSAGAKTLTLDRDSLAVFVCRREV